MSTRTITRRPKWLTEPAWRIVSAVKPDTLTTTRKPIQGFVVRAGELRFGVCTMTGAQPTLELLQAVSS